MKRNILRALAFAALAAGFTGVSQAAQDQDAGQSAGVTFKARAMRVSVVLSQLSRVTGSSITADTPLANEVMLLQVKDVPLETLLKKIAEATGGAWNISGGKYKLVRPSENAAAQLKAEVDARSAAIAKALEPHIKALQKQADSGAAADQPTSEIRVSSGPIILSPGATGPGVDAITKLLQGIGNDALAALPFDARTVYSTSPTGMQRALGMGAGQIVAQYVQDARASQTTSDVTTSPGRGRRAGVPTVPSVGGNLDLTPAKADLIVTRMGASDAMSFQLIVGDAQGRTVTRADMILLVRPDSRRTADVTVDSGTMRIDPSPLSAQFAKLMSTTGDSASGAPMRVAFVRMAGGDGGDDVMEFSPDAPKTPDTDKDWRTRISNPETNEPLAFCAGEALGLAADAAEMNIVAVIPDSALIPSARTVAAGGMTAGSVVAAAQTDWGLKAVKDGKWLLLKPVKQASSVAYRLDRTVLGKTLRQLASAGILTLDDRATYASGEPIAPDGANFEQPYFRLLNAAEASRLATGMMSGERKMLRFYAGLTIFQRQTLGSGKPIQISALGFQLRDMLADMVFNSQDGPAVGAAGRGPNAPQARMPMFIGEMSSERTEALPAGLPGGGVLTVATHGQPAVFGVTATGEKVAMGGPTIVFASDTGGSQTSGPTKYDLYVPGIRNSYTFNFQLLSNVTFSRTLVDTRFDTTAKPVPYDQLPEDLRKRVEQSQNGTIRLNFQTGQGDPPIRP